MKLRGAVAIALLAACGEDPRPSGRAEQALRPPAGLTQEQWGERLYAEAGCIACHHLNAVDGVGGSLRGILGDERRWPDGTTSTVDAAYLRESILDPDARIVEGATAAMPAYRDLLTDSQVDAIVAFIVSAR